MHGGHTRLSISRYQLPLTLAYAITDYKAQGATFKRAIVDLTPPPSGGIDANSPYVMLSRVMSLDGLMILGDFPDDVLRRPIDADVWRELHRQMQNRMNA